MDKGIFEPKYKSCADFAIQSMAVAGIETQQVAFRHHIENAKKLRLMLCMETSLRMSLRPQMN